MSVPFAVPENKTATASKYLYAAKDAALRHAY